MTAREILRAAGLPVSRSAAQSNTWQSGARSPSTTTWHSVAPSDQEDRSGDTRDGGPLQRLSCSQVLSRRGVHALPGGRIMRIESREENDFNWRIHRQGGSATAQRRGIYDERNSDSAPCAAIASTRSRRQGAPKRMGRPTTTSRTQRPGTRPGCTCRLWNSVHCRGKTLAEALSIMLSI